MANTTDKQQSRRPPSRVPAPQASAPRPRWQYAAAAVALAALAAVLALTVVNRPGRELASAGLPHTADYHALLVSPSDPPRLTLGTHDGLYQSVDGGRRWRFTALAGEDAMNLARPTATTIWLAGHEVFKKSSDGGRSWQDVHPSGLPGLDVHGFAVDPRDPDTLYAAIAGQGLYRSRDGGRTFSLLSGNSWKQTLRAQLMGLAINPANPKRVLATGAGIALSTDGGRSWRSVLDLPDGAGPVAWSPSNPDLAFAVGFDRVLYRSRDGGDSWQPVGKGT